MSNQLLTNEPSEEFAIRLSAVEAADSAQALIDTVEALAELKDERAIKPLIQVLGFNNPGAAVAAVEGLIQIGVPAVAPLLEKLDGHNYGARAWAIRALAGIGDLRGQDLLLEAAAEDFAMSVRRAAARGLGRLRWQDLPAEARLPSQLRSHRVLQQATRDEEWVVRYAAVVGLQDLAQAFRQHDPQPA
ncbi:MAG: HEAT repeat domain-containing protein, partial [Leptolyngbya sp. SIO4C1]|nr:HEAT repeat domain-containing protein [Leptolyngbya sp. SIO4C1]